MHIFWGKMYCPPKSWLSSYSYGQNPPWQKPPGVTKHKSLSRRNLWLVHNTVNYIHKRKKIRGLRNNGPHQFPACPSVCLLLLLFFFLLSCCRFRRIKLNIKKSRKNGPVTRNSSTLTNQRGSYGFLYSQVIFYYQKSFNMLPSMHLRLF